jgi:glycosyltransferase involved in cell wall biosynthesis
MFVFWEPVIRPLLEMVKPRNVLEIGAEEGKHTEVLLAHCAERGAVLHVIEPVPRFDAAALKSRYGDRFELRGLPSPDGLAGLPPMDAALLDGDHNWYCVYHELKALSAAAAKAGAPMPLFFLHDMLWPYGRRDLYYSPERIPEEFRHPFGQGGILPGVSELSEKGGLNRSYCNALHEGGPRNGVRTAAEDFLQEREGWRLDIIPVMHGLGILRDAEHVKRFPEVGAFVESLLDSGRFAGLLESLESARVDTLVRLENKRHDIDWLKGKLDRTEEKAVKRESALVAQVDVLGNHARELAERLAAVEKHEREMEAEERRREKHEREMEAEERRREKLEREMAAERRAGALRERDTAARHVRMLVNLMEETGREYVEMLRSQRWRAGNRAVRLVEKALRRPNQSQSPQRLMATLAKYDAWKRDYEDRQKHRAPAGHASSAAAAAPIIDRLARETNEAANDALRLCALFEEMHHQGKMVRASWRWKAGRLIVGGLEKLRPQPAESPRAVKADAYARAFSLWRKSYGTQPRLTETAPSLGGGKKTTVVDAALKPLDRERVNRLRVTQFTPPAPRNPFYRVIADELRQRGWAYDFSVRFDELLDPSTGTADRCRMVHFHQFDALYHDRGGDLDATRRAAQELLGKLAELKQAGFRLAHTFHNPWPHDRKFLEIDREFTEKALPIMDGVVVLSENARPFVAKFAEPRRIRVIPHPSFENVYGPAPERDEARRKLGLPPELFVFGHLGELKPYKGVEAILSAFEQVLVAAPDTMLVVAGRPGDAAYAEELRALAAKTGKVRMEARLLEDAEIPLWLAAFDLSVFAFRDIWVSSSVLLSQSYGVPVVAPELGGLPEYVIEEDTGFLYPPDGAAALAGAMLHARRTPYLDHLRYMCGVHSRKHSVDVVATAYEHFYAMVEGADPDGA